MEADYIICSSSSYPDICYSSTDYRCLMAEGYKAMAAEDLEFAEEALSITLETWPEWETEEIDNENKI